MLKSKSNVFKQGVKCDCKRGAGRGADLLWTWQSPMANCDISGICLRISSVTKCTPRCCGLRFIFFWNQAELVWIILAEEAMFDLPLPLSVASLNVYTVHRITNNQTPLIHCERSSSLLSWAIHLRFVFLVFVFLKEEN